MYWGLLEYTWGVLRVHARLCFDGQHSHKQQQVAHTRTAPSFMWLVGAALRAFIIALANRLNISNSYFYRFRLRSTISSSLYPSLVKCTQLRSRMAPARN